MGDKIKKRMNEKGQITIFIIIGIMIVVLAVIIILFYPRIRAGIGFESQNPSEFMSSCIREQITDAVEIISNQGGSLNPEHYILYRGDRIEYLCYTEEYYKTCVMQQPMLKEHIEEEIEIAIRNSASSCLDDLKRNFERRGYEVSLVRGNTEVELLPKRIVVTFNSPLTLKKGETERFDSIKVSVNNNLYELVSIANSILNFEARYGDSETTIYMDYYRDLKVEKLKQSEGSTIYILTDRNNPRNKLQFASRSLAWPPGYGTESMMF
jgi:hypothetical protein